MQVLLFNTEFPDQARQTLFRVDQIRNIKLDSHKTEYFDPKQLKKYECANVFLEVERIAAVPVQSVLVDAGSDFLPDIHSHKVQGVYLDNTGISNFEFEQFTLVGGDISGSGTDASENFILSGVCSDFLITFNKTYCKGTLPSVVYQGKITTKSMLYVVEGTFRVCGDESESMESSTGNFSFNLPRPLGKQVLMIKATALWLTICTKSKQGWLKQMKIFLRSQRASELVSRLTKVLRQRQVELSVDCLYRLFWTDKC